MSEIPPPIPEQARPRTPITTALLVLNAVVFFLGMWIEEKRIFPFQQTFALSLAGLKAGNYWQLLTYQFLHSGTLHILFNSWGIFVIGRAVEMTLGGRHYLRLYLLSGVVGGLMQMLGAVLAPAHFGGYVVGASAGLFGLVAAFSMLYPEQRLTVLLFFVIPISMKAKTLLWVVTVYALIGMMGVFEDNIAHAAHLGGMFGGLTYVQALLYLYHRNRRA